MKAHLAMDVTVRTDPENILMLEAKRNGSPRKVMACLREHSYLMEGAAPREPMFCLFPPRALHSRGNSINIFQNSCNLSVF